jgi:hypothetical protein
VVEIVRRNADFTLSGFKLCEGILREPEVTRYATFSNLEISCKNFFEKRSMHDAVSERK